MNNATDLAPERTTKPAASKDMDEGPGWFHETLLETGGRKFLNGIGKVPCEVLFVALQPTEREIAIRRPWSSRDAEFLKKALRKAGMDFSKCRFTYLVKHHPKKLTAAESKVCARMFQEELAACSPQIVVTLGAEPLKGVVGTSYRWDDVHGSFIVPDSVPDCAFRVFPTFSMAQVVPNPKWDKFLERDLKLIADAAKGIEHMPPECEDKVIHTPEEVEVFRQFLEHKVGRTALMLDCEWHGRNWMDPDRYFRTIQIGWKKGRVVTVEVAKEGGERCYRDELELMRSLKRLLESPKVRIAGHNVIADGEWLLSYGIDIRDRVMYDTMLAEHIIDQNGPFGLEALAMKYTPYGRYSTDVEVWVRRHKGEKLPDSSANGYGFVPRDMLLKYGYVDVDVLWYIMERQWPILEERGCLRRRGVNGEYPSLLDTALRTQRCTYDLERNGLPVDMKQLDDLTERYQEARSECLSKVMKLAREAGEYDFNPRSTLHLRKMLFGTLGLTPVKTTDGDDWGDAAGEDGMDSEMDRSAATDKTTLEILSGTHPFVDALLDFRRVDQACKTWLTKEKDGQPAGLYKDIWPDGTLKSRFSTLTETGRYRTASPNCFPGEVEVLTDRGWMRWDELYRSADRDSIKLAQWDVDTREITFDIPETYVHFDDAQCIRIHSDKQVDIVCTPDHRFTVYDRKKRNIHREMTAEILPSKPDWLLPQAGHVKKDGISYSPSQAVLICALQADGSFVKFGGIDWAFDKKRKVDRLVDALTELGIKHRVSESDEHGRHRTRIYVGKHDVPEWLWDKKFFGDWLLACDSDTIGLFCSEVWLWDGCSTRLSMYASAIKKNTDFVQIICLLCGIRGKIRRYVSNTGSVSWQVDASKREWSQTANLLSEDAGRHEVFCVCMPKDTVIVRYNGKVSFTNQSQNFPKKAEGYLSKIFGEGKEPPLLRTIVDPMSRKENKDGRKWVQLEGDFCQAEMFVAANISGDQNMLKALTTPGLDLHDKTAVDSFGLHMVDENGKEVTEDDLIKMAADLRDSGGAESEEFQHFMKTLTYIEKNGNRLTRAQFKNTLRVASKAINFGTMYGRGSRAISLQIKADTGDKRSIDEIDAVTSVGLASWKKNAYPQLWNTLQGWGRLLYTQGYVENPWGMRKYGYIRDGEQNASLERQFSNFPIQSTVAGTVQIAMDQMRTYILERGLPFRMQNQIHDAVMIECPIDYVDECKTMFRETMAGIRIPLPGGRWFTLDVDIDVYERWGVKMKA